MSRLIESIQVLNGHIINWPLHLERIRYSMQHHFGEYPRFNFEEMIRDASLKRGKVKLRILYDSSSFNYTFHYYTFHPIRSLKIAHDESIDYQFKFEDRTNLDTLYSSRSGEDDILVIKNGVITDSYYCNVALLAKGSWYTPLRPLLNGTKRKELIRDGLIHPKHILLDDLPEYSMICLFNALIAFGKIQIPVKKIH